MTRLEILVADDVHLVGTWGRTFIQIWRGRPSARLSARINELATAFVASSVVPATCLWVIESTSPPPDDVTRKNFATFSRDLVAKMKLAVIVAEGGGFRGALVRGVGAALTNILPHRSHFKFVDDMATGADLLAPYLVPGSGGPPALLRVVAEGRAKIPALV